MRLRAISVLLVIATFAAGCGRSGPPKEEADFLKSRAFDYPLTVAVSLRQSADENGNVVDSDDAHLLALFVKAGLLKAIPNTGGAPWWLFNAPSGTVTEDNFATEVGTRTLTGRTDEKYWSEGSTDLYAETIAYTFNWSDKIKAVANLSPMTGTIRVMMRKNASTGQWEGIEGSGGYMPSQNDAVVAPQILSQAGAGMMDVLAEQVQAARKGAFDQLEAQLAAQGVLARSPQDPNVLVSRQRHIAYDLNIGQNPGTFGAAAAYCAGQHLLGYQWRVPYINELTALAGSDTKIVDLPDHRLWGNRMTAPTSGIILYVSNTFVGNGGAVYSLDTINPNDLNGIVWVQYLEIQDQNRTNQYQTYVDVRQNRNATFNGNVLCVANVNG